MNYDNNIQNELTEGCESALESFRDMENTLSDLQDTVADALSNLHGDVRIHLYIEVLPENSPP